MGEMASRFSFNNKSPSHPVDSNQKDPHPFSHLTDYFVYGATCSFRLRIASIYFQLSMFSSASFALLKYFQLFGCPIVREVVSQFVPRRHFQEKKKRFVMMMMMLYADFKKTWPFVLIEISSDFLTSKLWKNLSFKSYRNFSFVVDEVFLADELQQESLCNWSACTRRAWMKQLGRTKLLVHRSRCGKYFLEIAVSIRNGDAILGWGSGSERLRGLFQPLLTVFWHNAFFFFYMVDRAAWK